MWIVTAVLFDKTGTLTEAATSSPVSPVQTSIQTRCFDWRPVELDSEHPLARAIVTAARKHGEPAPGQGLQGAHRTRRRSSHPTDTATRSADPCCYANETSLSPSRFASRSTAGRAAVRQSCI